ncbi:SRPBCC family protein [Streptomyces sp. NPDC012794]|uniref:SRPBCC family protein n=1 Tax=Streptomyces sp. NPDC012794 TaxID=3364850 RepID=UPI00367760B6
MRTISTEITIDATPRQVWTVLADFPRYRTWNPFIREAAGEAVPGERLALRTYPRSGRPTASRPTVLVAVPGRELRWGGPFLLRGLFDAEHFLRLAEGPDRTTRLEHGERYRGVLVPLLGKLLAGTARDLTAMNDALRARVESARTPS